MEEDLALGARVAKHIAARRATALKKSLRKQNNDDSVPAVKKKQPKQKTKLTEKQNKLVITSMRGSLDEVLVSKFNLIITRRDLLTLRSREWLNDVVINFYMNLISERGAKRRASHGLPRVYAMNTFFVPRLMQGGYSAVQRWTLKVDIFATDIVLVPVHVGDNHWCLVVINLKDSSIKYYDSLREPNPQVLLALQQYLQDESLDKRKQIFESGHFLIQSVEHVPQQENGCDCGVFSCMFAEFVTRNQEITFTQDHINYFRQKMIFEIITGKLLQ